MPRRDGLLLIHRMERERALKYFPEEGKPVVELASGELKQYRTAGVERDDGGESITAFVSLAFLASLARA